MVVMKLKRAGSVTWVPFVICLVMAVSGCQTAYYKTMEKFGVHKRDILVDRVAEARDSQEETKEQFQSALQEFSSVLNFHGGDLEEKYKVLKAELDRSESKAEKVHDRIASVESVSEALFEEWQEELEQFNNPSLRASSERQLYDTRQQYSQLITAMKNAERKIDPVLVAFRDQVLFLKHNLNAQAINSLRSEFQSVETEITALIKEMEVSIAEANAFISAMERK